MTKLAAYGLKVMFLGLVFLFMANAQKTERPYGNIKLLEGYTFKRTKITDGISGLINKKDGGLSIYFESGLNQGYEADPKRQAEYVWFRQQEVKGHTVFVAFTTSGKGTKYEPDNPRSLNPRRILLVTFPGKFSKWDAANFRAEVFDEQEIADVLLMVLTFDPTL